MLVIVTKNKDSNYENIYSMPFNFPLLSFAKLCSMIRIRSVPVNASLHNYYRHHHYNRCIEIRLWWPRPIPLSMERPRYDMLLFPPRLSSPFFRPSFFRLVVSRDVLNKKQFTTLWKNPCEDLCRRDVLDDYLDYATTAQSNGIYGSNTCNIIKPLHNFFSGCETSVLFKRKLDALLQVRIHPYTLYLQHNSHISTLSIHILLASTL